MTLIEELRVIGQMEPKEAADLLRSVGEDGCAELLESTSPKSSEATRASGSLLQWPFSDRPWQYTSHVFGYIPSGRTDRVREILPAGAIEADQSLRGASLRITLDRLRVADYPGSGVHNVLFDFSARNQTANEKQEQLHFNSVFRVKSGQQAPVIGYPIFLGLNVGSDGVALRCSTVNVKNEGDEAFLGVLESDVFRGGLRLAKKAQPAIAPLSEMALGFTKAVASRNRNIPVQSFFMGLDFSTIATGARLSEGSYVAVQVPDTLEHLWEWQEWVFDSQSGHLVSAGDKTTAIPFNYVVFGVSRDLSSAN